jgi:hypothetical protein
MARFTETKPTLDNYWRSIILFGRNVASYKFALGEAATRALRPGPIRRRTRRAHRITLHRP